MTRWPVPNRADPGRTTGTPYRDPGPPCTCNHWEAVHDVKDGVRARCCAGHPTQPCSCKKYTPKEVPGDQA